MGLNIKAAIYLRGKTPTWVAKKMGVKLPTLSEMINGNPTYDTMVRIAEVLGCDVAELFDRPAAWSKR
jgi:plasmid maintenance system antidote protein VapI